MSILRKIIISSGLTACAAGGYAIYWSQPQCHSLPEYSGPVYVPYDAIRHVSADAPVVSPEQNPGVRVYEDFLSKRERDLLLKELQPLKQKFGINLIQPMHAAIYRWQMSYLSKPVPVNMTRITGRHEDQRQNVPAWSYGDDFQEDKLPPQIRKVAQKIRAIPGLNLGKLRDVTINHRHSHFFRLDPHLDPELDGENVFIVGLDSDTVLTLSPLNYWKLSKVLDMVRGLLTMEDERDLVKRQAYASWTDKDVDVLLKRGTLVVMSGDARWTWTHGTRLGIEVDGRPGLHDWFGESGHVIPRNPERHSVVFAFDKPEQQV